MALCIAELQGKPLIFVLKLDEAEIINGKKFERVSLTLMNRALDPSIQKNSAKYFSVQSEQEIWPIACFQVQKESYEVLNWVFHQTKFPEVIQAHENGQLLVVEGVGEFKVEWHLSADMKTIKCMYGLKHGANSLMSCIYCNQERLQPFVGTVQDATQAAQKRGKATWGGGLFARGVPSKPVNMRTHSRFKHVLPIPLTRVHICTLHAQVRMLEKMLHLHFMFVWNMRNEELKDVAINQMEKSLSTIGVHGGNVQISQDPELSGPHNNVPRKPSLNGVVAGRLFMPSIWSGQDKVWKDVVQSEHNHLDQGQSRIKKFQMWAAFEQLQPYLTGLTLTPAQCKSFRSIVENWGRLYIQVAGEEHVTHYMVSLLLLMLALLLITSN